MRRREARALLITRIFFGIVSLLTILFIFLLSTKDAIKEGAPPLGYFFSPFHGFWQNTNGEALENVSEEELNMPGLKAPVKIRIDNRMVPHIFAENDHDLYYAQGYITARFRLWQMETQTRAAGGRLSEILGEKLLNYDKKQRRLGMLQAAKEAVALMEKDSLTRTTVAAYTNGVNAYINTLKPHDYPFEYKLLDYSPEPWSPVKTALLLKYMAWDLTSGWGEIYLNNVLKKFGKKVTDDLFPDYSPYTDPIIPPDTRWDFEKLAQPKAIPPFTVQEDWLKAFGERPDNKAKGSNNWAIGGHRTVSGFPILANDPHLSLKLPSLWFEIQLHSPTVNVYGVSLPGAPCVIIGFNESISWGVTNVGADVMDWYQIQFKDANLKEYWYADKWETTRTVKEEIQVRGKGTHIENVVYTVHGPVAFPENMSNSAQLLPIGCALKWVAHQPSNELLTFYGLNRAKKYNDYLNAIQTYTCPAQNFVYADNEKNIALWVNGKFPLKYKQQGKFILDGRDPNQLWQGWVPQSHNPHVKNPPRNFVSSANQASTDTTYPYYLDWEFEHFERGKRINQRLEAMQNASWDSIRMLQNDNYNLLAEKVLPKMFANLEQTQLLDKYRNTFNTVRNWDYENNPESVGASIFDVWWYFLMQQIWSDEFPPNMMMPDRARTAKLIVQDTTRRWYDDIRTPERETLPQLLLQSFTLAHDSLTRFSSDPEKWQWYRLKRTHIAHLANIPGLGIDSLFVGGGVGIVNATTDDHGPSWRMVVSLGGGNRGYGIYPGGQSGHPGSKYYDNFVQKWVEGKLDELNFLNRADNTRRIKTTLILKPR